MLGRALAALLLALAAPGQEAFDLLVRGGAVLDGSGAEATVADIGVREGRVTALGALGDATATRTIDATGLVVAPGFLDVHTHAEHAARRPLAPNFVRMGVTTIVSGNCGSSAEDLAAALAAIEREGLALNYATLVGHGTLRRAVLGTQTRAPTPEELERMRELLRQGMQAGAFGLSTGLIYVPGTYAQTDELIALAKVAAEHGGIYASHMRNEANGLLDAIDEGLRIGREAAIPVHLSHLKASAKPNWGKSAQALERLRAARAAGLEVTGDQYAYDASSTSLDVLLPSDELSGGPVAFARQLGADAAFRARMHQALLAKMDQVGFGDLSYCRIAMAPENEDLAGRTLAEAARLRLGREDRDAQAEVTLDLLEEARGRTISMIYFTMAEADVVAFLREPWIAVASDAGIRAVEAGGKPHPRGAGNNPRVLGRYVREQRVLPLALAVHKMTGLPAEIFGISGRGVIRAGASADLTIFDPATVQDRATYDEPLLPPAGIPFVVVNGVLVVDRGEPTGARPGRVLRHGTEAAK